MQTTSATQCPECGISFGHKIVCSIGQQLRLTNDSGHVAGGKPEADTSTHTATPWEENDIAIMAGAPGKKFVIAFMRGDSADIRTFQQRKEDTKFIVRACNRDHAFDELVKALEGVIRVADRATDEFDAARAALAKAGANN